MSEFEDNVIIDISDNCSVYDIQERFLEVDLSLFDSEVSSIDVNLEAVSSFDATFIQLLVFLKHNARISHKSLKFISVSDAVLASVKGLFLVDYLGMDTL